MKIKLGKNQPKPKYAMDGDAGFDLVATSSESLTDQKVKMMNLEIACEIPEGHYGKLVVRSSMAKRGVTLAHGTGIIDHGYIGWIHAPLVARMGGQIVNVEKGERIVQLLICPITQVDFEVVDELASTERGTGGFGSTGKN